jgi:hypothetical protein
MAAVAELRRGYPSRPDQTDYSPPAGLQNARKCQAPCALKEHRAGSSPAVIEVDLFEDRPLLVEAHLGVDLYDAPRRLSEALDVDSRRSLGAP